MKRVMYFASAALLLAAPAVYSQMPAGQKIGLATSLQRGYAGIKTNFTAAAEKMPEADYTFKVGSMPEARTYGQLIAHIAQAQFGQCAGLTGVPNPMAGKNLEQELKTKAELTKALADSFAICDKAFEAVTDANATEWSKPVRTNRLARRRSTASSCTATKSPAPPTRICGPRGSCLRRPSAHRARCAVAAVCNARRFQSRNSGWACRSWRRAFF